MSEKRTATKKKTGIKDSKVARVITSIIFAVVIWLVLMITTFPEISKTIKNIPIDFTMDGSYADIAGLSILNSEEQTVNIKIKGQRHAIGDYTAEDLKITVNLDAVRASGQYELALNVESVNGDTFIIEEMNPSTVHLEFDYLISKTFSVADGTLVPDLSNVKADSGFILSTDEIKITPSKITISGPKDYVDQVDSCVIRLNDNYVLNKSINVTNTTPVLYSGDAEFVNSKVSIDSDVFNVTIPIYMKKVMNLDVEVQAPFDDFDMDSLSYRITPPSITVKSQNNKLENVSEILLGYIDLRQVEIGSKFTFPIVEDNDLYSNISGYDFAEIIFDLEGYATKNVSIPNSQIYVINVPDDFRCVVEQEKIRNVTVVGPADIIAQIDSADVVAQIDMLDYTVIEGDQLMTVTIFLPNYDNVWCMGIHRVLCNTSEIVEAEDAVNPEGETTVDPLSDVNTDVDVPTEE